MANPDTTREPAASRPATSTNGRAPERSETANETSAASAAAPSLIVDTVATRVGQAAERVTQRLLGGELESQPATSPSPLRAVGSRLQGVGKALHLGAELLDDVPEAQLFQVASDRVERIASYVTETSADALVADARELARARPAWFMGGVFVAGLALGRFVKSAAPVAAREPVRRPRRRGNGDPSRGAAVAARRERIES